MPKSIQETLDHADTIAKRFEEYDPQQGDEFPVEEYLLERAVRSRHRRPGQGHLLATHRGAHWHLGPGRPAALRRCHRGKPTGLTFR